MIFFGNFRQKRINNLFTSLSDEIKNKIQNEGKNDDFKQYKKKITLCIQFQLKAAARSKNM